MVQSKDFKHLLQRKNWPFWQYFVYESQKALLDPSETDGCRRFILSHVNSDICRDASVLTASISLQRVDMFMVEVWKSSYGRNVGQIPGLAA